MSTTNALRSPLLKSALAALVAGAWAVPARAVEGSVVVLPFRNETKRKDIEFWRAGFQELLIQTLAERGVAVARRDVVARAWTEPESERLDAQKESARLRDRLPATVLVTGLFRIGADSVELVVEAWHEARQSRISAVHQVSGEDALFDAAELQAAAIADGPLPISVRGKSGARPTPEAFHDFVGGTDFLRSKEKAGALRAISAFESAISKSPEWALPYPYLLAACIEAGDKPKALRVLPLARAREGALPAEERTWLVSLGRQIAAEP